MAAARAVSFFDFLDGGWVGDELFEEDTEELKDEGESLGVEGPLEVSEEETEDPEDPDANSMTLPQTESMAIGGTTLDAPIASLVEMASHWL